MDDIERLTFGTLLEPSSHLNKRKPHEIVFYCLCQDTSLE